MVNKFVVGLSITFVVLISCISQTYAGTYDNSIKANAPNYVKVVGNSLERLPNEKTGVYVSGIETVSAPDGTIFQKSTQIPTSIINNFTKLYTVEEESIVLDSYLGWWLVRIENSNSFTIRYCVKNVSGQNIKYKLVSPNNNIQPNSYDFKYVTEAYKLNVISGENNTEFNLENNNLIGGDINLNSIINQVVSKWNKNGLNYDSTKDKIEVEVAKTIDKLSKGFDITITGVIEGKKENIDFSQSIDIETDFNKTVKRQLNSFNEISISVGTNPSFVVVGGNLTNGSSSVTTNLYTYASNFENKYNYGGSVTIKDIGNNCYEIKLNQVMKDSACKIIINDCMIVLTPTNKRNFNGNASIEF